jgi:hypothetical protein
MFFKKVIKDCEKQYNQESFTNENSWESMNIIELHRKQEQQWNKYLEGMNVQDKYNELIDHIIVSLIVAERIRRKNERA